MIDLDLCWRVEDVSFNGRPSPVEVHHDGWLIRASGGPVRRTNSLNPTRHRSSDLAGVLDAAERVYAGLGRATIVRVPSIADEMDALLVERGYGVQADSLVLCGDLGSIGRPSEDDVELIVGAATEEWISAWSFTDGTASTEAVEALRKSVGAIVLPKAFVGWREDGRLVSIAYGVVQHDQLVLEAVATHSNHRGRGLAFRTLSVLLDWARSTGAHAACLAVLADNEPALRLYRSLGLRRDLYRYHYRRNDVVGAI